MQASEQASLTRRLASTTARLLSFVAPCVLVALVLLAVAAFLLRDPLRMALSLQQVDPHPLYVMHVYGVADCAPLGAQSAIPLAGETPWACSLFSAYGNPQHALAGRNFDWDPSHALLLFTHPLDGYASVSMVNLAFARLPANLNKLDWNARLDLGRAAMFPLDGMNERGLVVSMAAVPDNRVPRDSAKPTIGSLCAIRVLLDHARDTDEAIALLSQYNIDFSGGPQIHYLIADPGGHSAVVEYVEGAMRVLRNDQPWQVATNFYLAGSTDAQHESDWRYRTARERLAQSAGALAPLEGLSLLQQVSQGSTQWSALYDMSTGQVSVVMGRQYDRVHQFQLPLSR